LINHVSTRQADYHFTVQVRDMAGDTSDRLFTMSVTNGMTAACAGLTGKQMCATDKDECDTGTAHSVHHGFFHRP
jgi:hypothetical protein